ncbi:glycosyl transferase family 51 [Kribbella flavida DSM 17836]|uniref:Glycosyl transferase family 51 n=1 Tax=Kribbella flavida (strain DSM 17836 / JCM 10339 / NBRC 14399) TaxID=479435 RepID=D2PUP9_KRIFD|nr:transglycosylase domain-containing protein [Kribbella flavida]ADB29567.1 glycosyl transferase family 51 [Kribbella flavida DSM 17836]
MRVREKNDRGVVQSVVLFLGVSALSGALAAGLAIPFVGLADYSTDKTHETLQDLPQELKTAPLAVKSKIVAADGTLIANLFEQNRNLVRLDQINPIMRKAIIAIEDDRFYEHGAMDAKGTLRAMLRNQSEGSVQQGGSSITQQYVKLSLIAKAKTPEEYQRATASTYQRKIAELRYAVAVEKQFSKDEILEKYLNLANFGDGAYGVEAAARHYFSTTAAKLTLPQAALLAGLVKNPRGYDPTNNAARAKDRRDLVLRRMQELSIITAKQANDAIRTPVYDPKKVQRVPNGCAASKYPFYCEYVVSKLLDNPALGKDEKARAHYIKTAGITVKTSLDLKAQRAAEAAIKERTKRSDTAVAAVTMVQPGTGLVKAMAQSRPYGQDKSKRETSYNYNVEKTYAGGYGGFQIGSTMKAFTIAAAIQKGIPLNYRINSPAQMSMGHLKFTTCTGTTRDPKYNPRNSTAAKGDLTMIQAAQASTNTYFLQLSQRVGLCSIATLAAKLGLRDAQNGQPLQQVISMTLGIDNVSPLMLSNAYATFAARGKYCKPLVVTSITSLGGKPISTPGVECNQALEPSVADGVNRVLHEVMEPPGTGQALKFGNSDLAGKTGTIQFNKAVWYAGYSSRLAAAAVVADADLPYTDLMRGHTLDGEDIRDASGSGTAGPIWKIAMQKALAGTPPTRFAAPTDKTVRGDVKDLPFVNGMNVQDATNRLQQAGFQVTVSPEQVRSTEAAGTVAYTSPRQRDGAPEGSMVTLHISRGNGEQPPVPPNSPAPPNPPTTGAPPSIPQCPPWHPKYPNCGGPRR